MWIYFVIWTPVTSSGTEPRIQRIEERGKAMNLYRMALDRQHKDSLMIEMEMMQERYIKDVKIDSIKAN